MNAPKKNMATQSRVEMMEPKEANNLRKSASNAYESMDYTDMELENIPMTEFTISPSREVPRANAAYRTPNNKPTRSVFGNVGNYPSNIPRKLFGGRRRRTIRRRNAARRTRRMRKN